MFFLRVINFLLKKTDSLFFTDPIVLTYHSVSDGLTPISVTVDNFRKQMDFLKSSGSNIISLENFLDFKKGKLKLSGRNFLITFDDGFRDVSLNALPILKKYGFPSAIFINPSLLGSKAGFATLEADRSRDLCSQADLVLLADGGVTIANHGYSHRQLSGLSESEIFSEYEKGYFWIKENFHKNSYPDAFVFPKGAKNRQVKEYLRSKGAQVLDDRIDIYSDTSLFGFILKLSRTYLWLRKRIFLIN